MALAVASTSTATANNSGSIVVTKPTGVASGDLLLIVGSVAGGAAPSEQLDITSSGFTESVRYQQDPGGSTTVCAIGILYKIADASDVSATDYTVTTVSRSIGIVTMFRVTGWVGGDPVYQDAGSGNYQDGNLTVNDTVSFSRLGQQLLIMAGTTSDLFDDPGGSVTFGSYQITSSDSNPTWTEVIDTGFTGDAGHIDCNGFCAYATSTDTSTITGYGFVKTGNSLGSEETTVWTLGILYAPIDDSGTSALHSADADVFEPAARYVTIITDAVTNVDLFPTGNGTHTTSLDLVGSSRGFIFDTASHAHPGMVVPASSGYSDVVSESGSYTDDTFALELTGFDESDTIFVRAFLQVPEGYVYGNEVSFTSIEFAQVNRWYPNGEGTINSVLQTGHIGNIYTIVKYLPRLSIVRDLTIYCAPTSTTGSTVIATLNLYFNQSSTVGMTKSITKDMASRGYVTVDINKPNINAVQIEIEHNTTDALGADEFMPSVAILDYEPTTTHTPSKD